MPKDNQSDEATSSNLYDLDPSLVEPGRHVLKLPDRGPKLGGAVPVRFPLETIDAIKKFADEQHVTVSAWIRREVEQSLRLHESLTLRSNIVPFKRDAFKSEVRRFTAVAGN